MERVIQPDQKKDLFILAATACVIIGLLALSSQRPLSHKLQPARSNADLKSYAEIPSVALLAHGNVAKKFHHQVSIPWDQKKTPQKILYGNKDFGHYTIDSFDSQNELKFSINPPTYKTPIDFCVQYTDGTIQWVHNQKFKNPSPIALKNIRIEVDGDLSHNFFLMSAQFVPDENSGKNRAYLPIIVNKFGEIIWAHLPQNGKTSFGKYPMIKPLGNGEYGILFGEKFSYFERFNFLGEIQEFIFPKEALEPYAIHHDFVYLLSLIHI